MGLLAKWVQEENERIEKENAKMKNREVLKWFVEVTVDPEVVQKLTEMVMVTFHKKKWR